MITYPKKFSVETNDGPSSDPVLETTWTTTAPNSPPMMECLPVAIPPEFGGKACQGFSPEDFYAMALANCFAATFRVFAHNSKLTYQSLDIKVEITVDLDDKKQPWIPSADFRVSICGKDLVRMQKVLDKVSKNCIILNSVKTQCNFAFHVEEEDK